MYNRNNLTGTLPDRILPAGPDRILPAALPRPQDMYIQARIKRRQAAQSQNEMDLSILERFNAKYGIPDKPPTHNFKKQRSDSTESKSVAEVPVAVRKKSKSKSPEKVPICPIVTRGPKFGVVASWPQPFPQPHILPPPVLLTKLPLGSPIGKEQASKMYSKLEDQSADDNRKTRKQDSSDEYKKRGRSRSRSRRRRRSTSSSSSDRSRSPVRSERGGRTKIDFSYLYPARGASTSHKPSDQDWMNETEKFLRSIQPKPAKSYSMSRKTRENSPDLFSLDDSPPPAKKKLKTSGAPKRDPGMVHRKLLALMHAMQLEANRGGRVDRQLVDRLYDELELNGHETEGNDFMKTMMKQRGQRDVQFTFPERSLEPIVKPNPCQFTKKEDIFQDETIWNLAYPGRAETPEEINERLAAVILRINKLTDDRTPLPLQTFKTLWKDE